MRVIVSGAGGFVGAHFVERALAAGLQVTGLHRSPRQSNRVLTTLERAGCQLKRADILDASTLQAALHPADCVVHFAAAFKEPGADATYFNRVNVEGTVNLLKAAHAVGAKRFVLCSTAGIYGQRFNGVADERAMPQPWNDYERSKLAAEHEVRERARALGMEYVILRPCAVYGPRDERLAKLFRTALKGRFPLFGKGEGRRHMVYVTDVADAFVLACTRERAANQEMIIAGPRAVPLRELLQMVATLANRRQCGPQLPLRPMLIAAALTEDICKRLKIQPPIYRRRMDFYLNDIAFNCARARELLGWEPKVDLQQGLAMTLRDQQTALQRARAYTGIANVAVLAFHCFNSLSPMVT